MTFEFYKLEIWQTAQHITRKLYILLRNVDRNEKYGLVSQIKRSSSSISANIAEAQGRFTFKDKLRIMYIARGELYETLSHLKLLESLSLISSDDVSSIEKELEILSKRMNAYIAYLKKQTSHNLSPNDQ